MDADPVIPENGYDVVHQNGAHDQLLLSGEDESILSIADKVSDIAVGNGNLESVKLEDHGTDNKSSLSEPRDDGSSRIPQVDNWPHFFSTSLGYLMLGQKLNCIHM